MIRLPSGSCVPAKGPKAAFVRGGTAKGTCSAAHETLSEQCSLSVHVGGAQRKPHCWRCGAPSPCGCSGTKVKSGAVGKKWVPIIKVSPANSSKGQCTHATLVSERKRAAGWETRLGETRMASCGFPRGRALPRLEGLSVCEVGLAFRSHLCFSPRRS